MGRAGYRGAYFGWLDRFINRDIERVRKETGERLTFQDWIWQLALDHLISRDPEIGVILTQKTTDLDTDIALINQGKKRGIRRIWNR